MARPAVASVARSASFGQEALCERTARHGRRWLRTRARTKF